MLSIDSLIRYTMLFLLCIIIAFMALTYQLLTGQRDELRWMWHQFRDGIPVEENP